MPPPPPPAPAPSAAIPGGKGPSAFAGDPDYLGPISATPQKMVEEMLALAGVTEADAVYDLGCNDGRVCITAAKTRGARARTKDAARGSRDAIAIAIATPGPSD